MQVNDLPLNTPQAWIEGINKCLAINPSDRPNCSEVLSFIKKGMPELENDHATVERAAPEAFFTKAADAKTQDKVTANLNRNPAGTNQDAEFPAGRPSYETKDMLRPPLVYSFSAAQLDVEKTHRESNQATGQKPKTTDPKKAADARPTSSAVPIDENAVPVFNPDSRDQSKSDHIPIHILAILSTDLKNGRHPDDAIKLLVQAGYSLAAAQIAVKKTKLDLKKTFHAEPYFDRTVLTVGAIMIGLYMAYTLIGLLVPAIQAARATTKQMQAERDAAIVQPGETEDDAARRLFQLVMQTASDRFERMGEVWQREAIAELNSLLDEKSGLEVYVFEKGTKAGEKFVLVGKTVSLRLKLGEDTNWGVANAQSLPDDVVVRKLETVSQSAQWAARSIALTAFDDAVIGSLRHNSDR